MAISIVGHLHEEPIIFGDPGKREETLIIRTGVLIFEFWSRADRGWVVDQLTIDVIELPPGRFLVQALASAQLASIARPPIEAGAAAASGTVFASGGGFASDAGVVQVNVSGATTLPVFGLPTDIASGWAVNFARADRHGSFVRSHAEASALGRAQVQRAGYTVHASLTPINVAIRG